MSVTQETKAKMQAAVEHFKTELKNLRSNRANPGVLDGVSVEVYGSMMRIKELASVSVPEPRQIAPSSFALRTRSRAFSWPGRSMPENGLDVSLPRA